MERTRSILFVTFDVIGPRRGGAAIRVLGLARALARTGFSVTVVAPRVESFVPDQFAIQEFDLALPRKSLRPLLREATLVVLPMHALVRLPFLSRAKIPLVFDLYDPFLFELMAAGAAEDELEAHLVLQNQVLRRGDFFLCASERQRDHWLGELSANGRKEPNELIAVVPFGIDPSPPPIHRSTRDIFPSIPLTEKILVWPGGIWDWTDPETLLKAMRLLETSGIHLVFFAGKHPGEDHEETAAARKARALAGGNVLFINDYIPYERRGEYFAECDAAVSAHRATLESQFAYRTRFLDCLWAGLPIICTEGDVFAELVVRQELGLAVPPENPEVLARAIERIALDSAFEERCRANVIRLRPQFDWNDAIKSFTPFCSRPRVTHTSSPLADTRGQLKRAQHLWRTKGAKETMRRLRQHLRNR
ncbi:MAG: glycosyltransferase [Verrucomicrobiota bacterium]|nr:glycosyltransferase [Verrucomicrobiota bacterium]